MNIIISLIFAAYVASSGTAAAESDTCKTAGDLAEKVMQHRQANTPMSELMGRAGENAFFRATVIAAYSVPSFRTAENQANAIADFRNEIEADCYMVQP